MSGIRYPHEFKLEAARQVTEHGYKLSEVSRRLGVTPKTLRGWIKQYGVSVSSSRQALSDQQSEIRKLKAELRRVTEERDILKEAAAYFASESRKGTRS